MRITAGLAFIVSTITSVMALKEAPVDLQIGKKKKKKITLFFVVYKYNQVFSNVFLPRNVLLDQTMGKERNSYTRFVPSN